MRERERPDMQITIPVEEPLNGPVRIRIDAILRGAREVIFVHEGQDYRLRLTSRGKLILTK